MNDAVLNILLVVVLAAFVIFTFRNSRKNKAKQAEARSQIVPGAEIMTNFGLFGELTAIDEERNDALIEIAPGTIIRVHRQTLARVVDEHADAGACRLQVGDQRLAERGDAALGGRIRGQEAETIGHEALTCVACRSTGAAVRGGKKAATLATGRRRCGGMPARRARS